jgi:hypothetical protein
MMEGCDQMSHQSWDKVESGWQKEKKNKYISPLVLLFLFKDKMFFPSNLHLYAPTFLFGDQFNEGSYNNLIRYRHY